MQTKSNFKWKFHRIGGLDQVTLRTAEELRHIGELDPKLWVALSCPSSGLEFDSRTLALIDGDKDGRIRIPEVVEAVEWACGVLHNPEVLVEPAEAMPLSVINTDTEEGGRLYLTARRIMEQLGKKDSEELTAEDAAAAVAGAANQTFNGDGVIPALEEFDADIRAFVEDALAVIGGVEDASGKPGINLEIAGAFMASLRNWKEWKASIREVTASLGEDSAAAWDLIQELREKIDDYYLRCDLASYSPDALPSLNADEQLMASSEQEGGLASVALEELPLARVGIDRPLSVSTGINPAWRGRVERLFSLVKSHLAQGDRMTRAEWAALCETYRPFDAALAARPEPVTVETAIAAASSIDRLGEDRVAGLLDGGTFGRFEALVERDLAVPAATEDIAAVERLVLYYRHLYRLLMNFASFYDFYSLRQDAAFLAGTLYVDGRSCRLCLPVDDVARHSTLAAYSEICLLYCTCRRRKTGESGEPEEEVMHIVGAMTAGDSDLLLEGRNGVFVDNSGQDWDATLVKVIAKPISLRQALWEPYKRLGRMISEQVTKFAGEKQEQLTAGMGKKIGEAGASVASGKPPASGQGFDIGKSVGIFAAVGLALGAIGTAVASIANALFALSWWQFPLVLLGAFLLISGPSVVLAWVKLRKRTLGPLLEASGWAVNGQVPINLGLGSALTSTAELPANASRSYKDPFKRPSRWPWIVLLVTMLLGGGLALLWFTPAYWNTVFESTPLVRKEAMSEAEKGKVEAVETEAAKKAEAARAEAAKADAAVKAEAAKTQAEQAEAAARAELEKAQAAKAEAARLEAEKIAAEKAEALARTEAEKAEAAKKEAAARAQAEKDGAKNNKAQEK